jgi:uncharacterized protein (DUF1800 family)
MQLLRRAAALLSIMALLSGTFGVNYASGEEQTARAKRLTEDQRILHVLDRLGFGARPGDVERVKAIGLDRYIEQQLHPETISDSIAEAKVQNLPALSLTTAELYAKYPQPGQLIRQLQKRGDLPADLAALRDNRKNTDSSVTPNGATTKPNTTGDTAKPEERQATGGTANDTNPDAKADNASKRDYREAIRQYYMENNLHQPQELTAQLQASRILRAMYSERQLQEVMVDFWTNHFNVFTGKGADRWLLVSYDRDTIRPHAFGKFEDLLVATAQSPAMLFYLDNFQSVSPSAPKQQNKRLQTPLGQARNNNPLFDPLMHARRMNRRGIFNPNIYVMRLPPQQSTNAPNPQPKPAPQQQQQQRAKRGINENYARELMELHTLGVDGGYTQKDVQEVARCFTGWTILDPRGYASGAGLIDPNKAGTFYFNPRLHDDGEKVVLGHKIPAGGGIKDGYMVLDILAHRPSTASFIATKLARRFVMDDPTPQLVGRIADAYMKSDGDIRETLRAIFTAPEFNAPENYRAKIKTPFELAVSAIRTLGGDTDGSQRLHGWIARMGEPLYGYQAPTGYPDKAENWVNTGALLERLNFGLALASNRIPGTRVDLTRFVPEAGSNSSVDKERILNRFLDVIVRGDISPNTKASLLRQLNAPLPAPPDNQTAVPEANEEASMRAAAGGGSGSGRRGERGRRDVARADLSTVSNPEVVKIVGLILGSPEFQRQ